MITLPQTGSGHMVEPTDQSPLVVVAPDKFKGSLTAAEAADILHRAIRRASPRTRVLRHPIADGGEGTVQLALEHGFTTVTVSVTGPLGDPAEATYALDAEGTAVMELAQAAGLALLPGPPTVRTAGHATTLGVGEMIRHGLDRGVRRIILGLGGSASTDGGAGMAQALGVRILDRSGNQVGPGGAGLTAADTVDLTGLDPRLRDVDLVLACDVDNPLTGTDGAAQVYGPQKGADPGQVGALDDALQHWASLLAVKQDDDRSKAPGTGAAGGTAFAGVVLADATIRPGIDVIAELTGLEAALMEASLVIIGEGSLDEQSLRGKGPIGIAARARKHKVPVVAVVGRTTLSAEQVHDAGLRRVYALADREPRPEVCMDEAGRLVREIAEEVARDWLPAWPTPAQG